MADSNAASQTSSIKSLTQTDKLANPLSLYASSSYAWSFWFLDIADANSLITQNSITSALNWMPTQKSSYVLAEDSGLYPNYRVPGFERDYNIKSVQFDCVFAHSQTNRSSNVIEGSMTILEPMGLTLIEAMQAAGVPKFSKLQAAYTMQPYMLQLDFFGYDDFGGNNSIPLKYLRKRFPICVTEMSMSVTESGAEYTIGFVSLGHQGYSVQYSKTPKQFTVTAGTVKEFFDSFEQQLNTFWVNDMNKQKNAIYADQYKFNIDPTVGKTKLNYSKIVPLANSNPNQTFVDLNKNNFNIPAGTDILSIIDRVFAQSVFLLEDQLKLENASDPTVDQTKPVNIIRTQSGIKYQGATALGNSTEGVYDSLRNQFPILVTYNMHQYPSYKGEHNAVGNFCDSGPFSIKEYQYLYTGQNTEILDFNLHFDLAYYQAALGYTNAVAASQVTATVGQTNNILNVSAACMASDYKATPSYVALSSPDLQSILNPTPLRTVFIVNDQQTTHGMGLQNNPSAQIGADVLKSIYTQLTGDMVEVTLTILGDPILIKQDDWLYVVDPTDNSHPYNKWNEVSQSSFANLYGHIRTDVGDVIVSFIVNTPIDSDIDVTNEGLVYPRTAKSSFSGQYRIISIKSMFNEGVFTQELSLVRYINDAYIQGANAANANTNRPSTTANAATPAAQATSSGGVSILSSVVNNLGIPALSSVNITSIR